jgi:capsular exopolysaccharide synthesis family protein
MNSGNEPIWSRTNSGPGTVAVATRGAAPSRPASAPQAAKGVSYLRPALEHKFLILTFIVLGIIAGTISVTYTTPMYSSSAAVELVGVSRGFNGGPNAGSDDAPGDIATEIEILKSRAFLNRVMERMTLELTPQVTAPTTFFTRLRNRLPFSQQDPLVQSRQALAVAAGTLTPKPVGQTRLIDITCMSTSPEVASQFINTFASEQAQQAQSDRSNSTQQKSQVMDSQMEEAKARLQQATEKLNDFIRKSGSDFFPAQSTLADAKMGTLRLDVATTEPMLVQKRNTLEVAKSTPLENLPEAMNDAQLLGLRNQITAARHKLDDLSVTFTSENIKVKQQAALIGQLEQDLHNGEVNLVKRYQADYDTAVSQARKLNSAYSSQTHSVAAQSEKMAEYQMLNREVDTAQLLYNSLLQASSTQAVMALAPTAGIKVIDPATASYTPVSPNPKKNIPAAAAAGGVLGYGLVMLGELLRRKKLDKLFESPGYTQTVLGVPELGVIPSTSAKPVRKLPFRPGWKARNGEPEEEAGLNGNGDALSSLNVGDRSSMLSESFRQTLVSLLRTKPRGHNPVYVITSAGPGEGKTSLSANLARAMAEIGQRVLLVDADLRRPHVHRLLGLGDHPGLSDVLASTQELRDLNIGDFIQTTEIDNLSVMTHGTADSETPALLFFSPRVPELVSLVQSQYDCVLFDTAPALPFPDARLWAKHADGIVLIVRAGVTTREGASAACERFLSDGIPVLGTILNDWTPQDDSGMAYYYYDRYSSAGPRRS